MLTAIAALSLMSSLTATTIDVPYLPQTDALCGGAAAAMVFRYWGDAHADVQQFAELVDRREGGIADGVLVDAIARRGWSVDRFDGSLAALGDRLAEREPVIVLLADRGTRYHYVVVVGREPGAVFVHDPSWGPSRRIPDADFLKRWKAASFWALVVRPGPETAPSTAVSGISRNEQSRSAESPTDECTRQLDRAIAAVRERGVESADDVFGRVRQQCPASAGPLRELAGIRFAQRRWADAASLARQALALDPRDEYALDVLGSSLFMRDDPVGALRAWNRIGKPTLDRVRISGLRHARYQVISEALHLTTGTLLTADAFARARRSLDELPDHATARLDVRPDADGYAAVDVVIVERSAIPRGAADWAALGLGAAVDREVTTTLPGFTGEGDVWSASWRWWANRPRVAAGFAAPHVGALPGLWRVDASWEVESYAAADSSSLLRESRGHVGVSVSDWLGGGWRYIANTGFDEWSGDRRAASIGAGLEHRLLRDRVSLLADGEMWLANGSMPSFSSATLRARWTSPLVVSGWAAAAGGGLQHVTDGAPLALWSGAGDGHERGELLRAHPMLDDGVINLTSDSVFGRTLAFGNAEAQRWFDTPWPARFGVALFADLARASDRSTAGAVTQLDLGAGLRLHLPGVNKALRVDVAHGIRDGANALTIGWGF